MLEELLKKGLTRREFGKWMASTAGGFILSKYGLLLPKAYAQQETNILGDMDNDGYITIKDITTIMKLSIDSNAHQQLTSLQRAKADITFGDYKRSGTRLVRY